MPLIRFQMSDVLNPIPNQSPSPFLKVECGVGRPEGIAYFTTEQNNQVTVQPIEMDPLMPEGVKAFTLLGERANIVECTIFIDDKYTNQQESILLKTKSTLKDFFTEKGLRNIHVEVSVGKDYKINPFSLKTQLWQKPKEKSVEKN